MYSVHEAVLLPILFVVCVIIAALCGYFLKDKSDKIKNIPFLCITITLLVLEVFKITLYAYQDNLGFWDIPLHFCGMFMVWFSLHSFGKGKVKQAGALLSFVSCCLFLFLFYFGPTTVIGDSCKNVFESFTSFHTLFYHQCIILYLALLIAFNSYKPEVKTDLKHLFIAYPTYFVVAVTMANLLNTNYCNFLYSNIPFMQKWLEFAGYIPYLATMFCFGMGVPIILIYLMSLIHKKFNKQEITQQ